MVQCRPGSCYRTRRTDWPDWTGLDTSERRSLSPVLSSHALLSCTESRLSEERLGQLRRRKNNMLYTKHTTTNGQSDLCLGVQHGRCMWRHCLFASCTCAVCYRLYCLCIANSVSAQGIKHTQDSTCIFWTNIRETNFKCQKRKRNFLKNSCLQKLTYKTGNSPSGDLSQLPFKMCYVVTFCLSVTNDAFIDYSRIKCQRKE